MKGLIQTSLVLIVIAFAGCNTSSHVIVGKARAPISPDDVKIYVRPPTKYEEIALLDSSSLGSPAFTNQQKMNTAMRRLKEEAAKLGANGILLRGAGDQSAGTVSTGTATATSQGSTTTAFGTGVSVPVIYKAASGIAIFVLEE